MPAFLIAIFLSAFLLFQVQPIIARYILPWYGGSPAVWTSCMLFFQVGLLAGYGYAHFLASCFRGSIRWQAGIHLAVTAAAILFLPITPDESLRPSGTEASPVGGILFLLLSTVGLPYVAISASGPLLQHWFGMVEEGRSPYRLYAISNLGSLLGLLTYPLLFEPRFRLGQQTALWSGGFVVYAVLVLACAALLLRRGHGEPVDGKDSRETDSSPRGSDQVLWIALAACGSVLLLGVTNQMCQDVAVVPFLWVLPLSLYLVTFIIAFDHPRWYFRPAWIVLATIGAGALAWLLTETDGGDVPLGWQIGIFSAALSGSCMVCHGELVRLKPHRKYLTRFYLAVSLGGALGGIAVSLVAPRIFSDYLELPIGLLGFIFLAGLCLVRERRKGSRKTVAAHAGDVAWASLLLVMTVHFWRHHAEDSDEAIASDRSFYGILSVHESFSYLGQPYRTLFHGQISHGRQFLDDDLRTMPISYYTEGSGPSVMFSMPPHREDGDPRAPLKYGVVGLGIGTLAAFAEAGDSVVFYEINREVETMARKYFTYLDDCRGEVEVILGDGRTSMERELETGTARGFDLLFLDAFSGDSIPMHLVTREALEVYFRHLAPDGALVFHITNLYIDLSHPIRTLAADMGMETLLIENEGEEAHENYSAWVVVSRNTEWLEEIRAAGWSTEWWWSESKEVRWTDDYSNLLEVIDW